MKTRTLTLLAFLSGCGSQQSREARPAPGEEPIETASLPDEDVVPLEPEPQAQRAPVSERPCSWAKAWSDPVVPDPLLAGIGGAPNPERVSASPVQIPIREPSPRGEITVEIVVLPDGSVSEAAVVSSTNPPWPEAEAAVVDAVKTWRYEPPTLGGTPISVCTTIVVRP